MAENTAKELLNVPVLIYGTAWKGDSTADLTRKAIRAGFMGIDTAAERKNYREDFSGSAVRECLEEGIVKRNEFFIQTKFTPTRGFKSEDLPYNTSLSLSEQVRSSVESSLHNLRPTTSTSCSGENSPYVDCLILHVPLPTAFAMLEVWTTMESYHPYRVRNLGLSNVTLQVLRWVYEVSTVKPSLVQNRWCAETGYDVAVRTYCAEHGIVYQAYGILTKSLLLASEPVQELAELANVSRATSLYYLVIQMGVVVLNGTRDDQKMISDHIEFRKLRRLANQPESQETWSSILDRFGYLLAARA